MTNSSGSVIENTSYDALGNVLTGGAKSRYNYEGREQDTVIGDTDFNARRYSPALGIFTSPDPLISNAYDSQSLNRYMFERGSPLNRKDPTGHFYWLIELAESAYPAVVGFVVVDVFPLISQAVPRIALVALGEKVLDSVNKRIDANRQNPQSNQKQICEINYCPAPPSQDDPKVTTTTDSHKTANPGPTSNLNSSPRYTGGNGGNTQKPSTNNGNGNSNSGGSSGGNGKTGNTIDRNKAIICHITGRC